jgi:hypothetical protein
VEVVVCFHGQLWELIPRAQGEVIKHLAEDVTAQEFTRLTSRSEEFMTEVLSIRGDVCDMQLSALVHPLFTTITNQYSGSQQEGSVITDMKIMEIIA